MKNDVNKFIPLSEPTYMILWALIGSKRHGYAIIKAVEKEKNTAGFQLLTGTLYRNIDKLLKNGLIKKVEPPSGADSEDKRRVYYTASGLGEKVFEVQQARYTQLGALGGSIFG